MRRVRPLAPNGLLARVVPPGPFPSHIHPPQRRVTQFFSFQNRSSRILVNTLFQCPPAVTASLFLVSAALVAVLALPRRAPQIMGPPAPATLACPPWAEALVEPRRNLFELSDEDPPLQILDATVRPGQTLIGILGRYLAPQAMATLIRQTQNLSRNHLQSGQPYRLTLRDQELVTFEYDLSPTQKLVIKSDQGELGVRLEPRATAMEPAVLGGAVATTFSDAVRRAGGNAELARTLAEVFGSDLDSGKNLQKGDSFRVVVEKRAADGKYIGFGRVLAAELVSHGQTRLGFAHKDDRGNWDYFDAAGRPLRQAFLRAPLQFERVSSEFADSRLHPILRVRKPHYGVDLTAPVGTPVWTVADGEVVERGSNPAAGNYVTVRHDATYVTRYNHLSRFAEDLDKGARVRQGQVIGYVGQTGYATGPHLDFRLYKNGTPINPLPGLADPDMNPAPLAASQLAAFKQNVSRLTALLQGGPQQATELAERDTGAKRQRLQ